ncbi:MAG: LysR substrate-binding domain-containing protein [Gammaproteobacteria bacterium]|nr:LysR substrate-binding domain-containing protein [Gammaproteobacteria bacterium]MDH5727665.1 LysR substrate-binding domain-containing protein [Gammaproteobacteria bacterium]
MHITFRQLQVFESVARNLSYTKAAKELHLSQPAVSMQIKQLEDQVEAPLFEQLGKTNFLTEIGRELYHYTRRILGLLDEADEVIHALKGLQRGTLDVAVATTANDFATRLLAAFARDHEEISFRLDVTNRESLIAHLDNNEKDLVIMGRPPEGHDLVAESFMENPLVVIAPPNHPLVKQKNIPSARLVQETFVVREQASGTRQAIERYFDQHEVSMSTSMEMTSNEAIKQAVEAGLGLGIVSIHTLRLEMETRRLAILDVEDFPILRHWYIVHRSEKRLSPVAQGFKDFVLSRGKEFAGNLLNFK